MVSTGASTPESSWVEHPETTQPSISHHIRDATPAGSGGAHVPRDSSHSEPSTHDKADVGRSRDVSGNSLQFELVLTVFGVRLIHITRVEGLTYLRATVTTVPAVICRAAHDAGSTTMAIDASYRLTAITESGVVIGVITSASELPESKITAKEPGKLDGKNLRAHLMLRHRKPASVPPIKRFASNSGTCS